MTEQILFLTGKLAERPLQRVIAGMQPEFAFEVRNIGISVAALMTADMIARRVSSTDGAQRVLVPGLCRGDLDRVAQALGVPVERGPADLKDLPAHFGRSGPATALDRHDVRIFAEIVDAPALDCTQILERARRHAADGADVIDLGCLPDTPFPQLEEAIRLLRQDGFAVSVDSMDPAELLRAGRAGADYLLSLNEDTLGIVDEVPAIPVLIPKSPGDLDSLYCCIDRLRQRQRAFLADSVLDPIHFGFTESLCRYAELRRRYPDIEIMMGVGNLTELTEADTTGINAVLFGIISELRLNAVLTTEVSPHARSAVREAELARRIMFAAREAQSLPKGLHGGLLALHERKPFPYSAQEIAELAAAIRDPSYRVQVSAEGIHVFNRDGMLSGQDPFELFPQLTALQEDAPHAFYMGVELAKARIAWQLGKRYVQDEELGWGVTVPPQAPAPAAAHALKPGGSTLQASRQRRARKKK